ncbi:MAG: AsmA family protein [Pseudomonadota bacterium]
MKKILIVLVVGFIALIAVASIVLSQLDLDRYKPQIATLVKEKTGYDVTFNGAFGVSLLPLPHVTLSDVTVTNAGSPLAHFGQVDVRVALLPLLSKTIDVDSLVFDTPVITLEKDANGQGNWEVIAAAKDDPAPEAMAANAAPEKPAKISLDDLRITDGRMTIKDAATGKTQVLDLPAIQGRAESLDGPFALKGDMVLNDVTKLAVDLKTGELGREGHATPVQGQVTVGENAGTIAYEGVIQTKPVMQIEGDLDLDAANLAELLTAIQGAEVKIPADLNKSLSLSGRVKMDENALRVQDAKLGAAGVEWTGMIAVNGLKGDAPKQYAVDLKSDTKTSDKGVTGLLAGSNIKLVANTADNGATIIQRAQIQATDTTLDVTGQYTPATTVAAKPSVILRGTIDRLDVDALTKLGQDAAGPKAKIEAATNAAKGVPPQLGFSLPINLQTDLTIGALRVQGKDVTDVTAALVAQGNRMTITRLSGKTVANTQLQASGVVGDTQTLSGLDVTASGQTGDVEALMAAFGQKAPELKTKIGAASFTGTVKGSLNNLVFDGNATALAAKVNARGQAAGLPGKVTLSNVTFGLQHPNLVKAIQIVDPAFSGDAYLQSSVDMRAGLALADKKITVNSLSGKIGPIQVDSAAITVDQSGSVPAITGRVALNELQLPGDTKSSGTAGAGSSAGAAKSGGGRWSNAPMKLDFLNSAILDLDLSARSITQGQWRLDNAKTKVMMRDGTLTIPSLQAGLFGGSIDLKGRLSQTGGSVATEWSGGAQNVQAEALLAALQKRPNSVLQGTIDSFRFDVETTGNSQSALVRALDGELKAQGRNIVIKGVDIQKLAASFAGDFNAMSAITGVLNSTLNGGATRFDVLQATMPIKSGIVTMSPVYLDSTLTRFDITGDVNLPNWYMDIKTEVIIKDPADAPKLNMVFRGPIDKPVRSVAETAVQDYLKRKLTKKLDNFLEKKGLGGLLGGGSSATQQPTPADPAMPGDTTAPASQPATAPTPEKAAEELLRSLF